MSTFVAILVVIMGVALLLVPAAIMDGWALSILWGWFLVPTLKLAPLTIAQAIGMALTVRAVISVRSYRPPEEKWWISVLSLFTGPLLVVGCGWIVKQWL